MFNFFKKKELSGYSEAEFNPNIVEPSFGVNNTVKTKQNDINAIIREIHKSYDTSVDRLLAEAKEILANCETEDIVKGERLSKLGFINSFKAKQSEEILRKKAEAEKELN